MPELPPSYQALTDVISAVSQRVHRTPWAHDTEYEVWHLFQGPSAGWGWVSEDDLNAQLDALWRPFRAAECWIYRDSERGGLWSVGLPRWRAMYEEWAVRRRQELAVEMAQLTETLRAAASSAQHAAEEAALAFPAPTAVWKSPATALHRARAQRALLDELLAEPHHIDDERSQFTCRAAAVPGEDVGGSPESVCGCGRDERVFRRLTLLAQVTGHLALEGSVKP
ncbi:hypothetical protein ABTZ78_17330 [Streptomyces bauhiniae]|uniref:hypothetical protein n=1 Tax=Streptomyces bauhiniae TaxID=2340725 RepID=UPI0033324395